MTSEFHNVHLLHKKLTSVTPMYSLEKWRIYACNRARRHVRTTWQCGEDVREDAHMAVCREDAKGVM